MVQQSTCTLGRSLEDFLNAEGFLGLLNTINCNMFQMLVTQLFQILLSPHFVVTASN